MHRLTSLFVILLVASSMVSAKAQAQEPISNEIGQRYVIESKILGEPRPLLIHLPEGYTASKEKHPVIYLLDGESHFRHAVNATSILRQYEMMPKSIVVAIPNLEDTRGRDLGSERANFERFIVDEVINFVAANFRTNGQRTLFGHSAAGGFVLSLLRNERGDSFDNFIVASPAMSMKSVSQFETLFDSGRVFNQFLYLSLGSFEAEKLMIQPDANRSLVKLFSEKSPKSLSWHYDEFPEQGHMTTPYLTLYRGLTRVFRNHQ